MAKSTKRRKTIIFSLIGLVLIALTAGAFLKKREAVITIQTEKIARHNLTELVVANGKIQPVLQVKISPEVSGEIIELPVKEGQAVKKGDLILKIKPDFYIANRNQAEASYKSSLAGKITAEANLEKASSEFKRNQEMFDRKLISESIYIEFKTGFEVAKAQVDSATHQVDMSKALRERAQEELAKTTIVSPLDGTVSKLNSQLGERVVGTATMAGTEVMTIADLNEMEARVDIGEIDVVLIQPGQNARLEVDAFKDRKFTGTVTEIANSSRTAPGMGGGGGGNNQEATKFEVKIRIKEKEPFRPGMSVTAEIETRSRTNVLCVPIASVTTRLPKDKDKDKNKNGHNGSKTNAPGEKKNTETATAPSVEGTNDVAKADKKNKENAKPIEVVFLMEGERAKMVPVKIGISDDSFWEVTEGLQEGQEVVSGGYRAISRDLEDGKKVRRGTVPGDMAKDKDKDKDETKSDR
jgi:HlyD family secretion protein